VANVNSNSFTIGFAAVSCIISGAILAGASLGLKDLQQQNVKVDKQRSVLLSAGLIDETTKTPEIVSWFENKPEGSDISSYVIDTVTGKKDETLKVEEYLKKPDSFKTKKIIYECKKPGSECLILPIKGQGLWGPLFGYIALSSNGEDVLGICFYDHKETPGLGAEITEPWFTQQFLKSEGKKLLKTAGDFSKESFVGMRLIKGTTVTKDSDKPYVVDGISGATITSKGVSEVLTSYLRDQYAEFLAKRRT
jgi:Na+-transporting NADH:ubiquinone oxidoreductase subunit C